MKRTAILVLALILTAGAVNSQAAKSIYFELGGPGLASINFDSRFSKKEDGLGGRIGVGGFSIDGTGIVLIPVGLNYLLGKDGKNYFEIGGGITPVIVSNNNDNFDNDDDNFSSTFGYLNFGYRLQPAKGGFTFRAFITPIFGSWGFFPYWGGVSFGYKF
jgi:hypothetical protein